MKESVKNKWIHISLWKNTLLKTEDYIWYSVKDEQVNA